MKSVNKFANFFIDYFSSKGEENDLTNMKLNKLLYFAYGIYLARTGKKLFNADFRAYPYGPVETTVYANYCSFIHKIINYSKFPNENVKDMEDEEFEALVDTLNNYGDKSAWALSDLTHNDIGSPWKMVDYKKKEKIKDEDMLEYFSRVSPKQIDNLIDRFGIFNTFDKEGNIVFPNDDEDRNDSWD